MKKFVVYSSKDFRDWLQENQDKERRVSLVLYKKHTSKPSPSHRELMSEAICFGWIDTTIHRVDEDRYIRKFTSRTKNSKWSQNTLHLAKELVKKGKMTSRGLKFYQEGLQKPTHDHGLPKNPNMPKDLKEALEKDEKAKKNFSAFPPSTKKMFYFWILSAKLPQTIEKRTKETVKLAKEDKKNMF